MPDHRQDDPDRDEELPELNPTRFYFSGTNIPRDDLREETTDA